MILSALLMLTVIGGGAAQPGGAAQRQVALHVEFDRVEWIAGEPVVAYVGVRNVGATPTSVRFMPQPDLGMCRYRVTHAGTTRTFLPWALKDSVIPAVTINPQELVAFPVKLFFGSDGFTFSQVGTYTVQVTCSGIPEPASTTVRVLAPRSALETAQSRSLLNDQNVGYFFLFEGGDHLVSAKTLLQTIAGSTTVFQPYASVVLGLSLARDFASIKTGTLRPADTAAARRYFSVPEDANVSAYYLLARKQALARMAEQARDQAQTARYRREILDELNRDTRTPLVRQALGRMLQR